MSRGNHPWRNNRVNKFPKSPKGDTRTFREKICLNCKRTYRPTNGRQLYCKECRAIRYADDLLESLGDSAY